MYTKGPWHVTKEFRTRKYIYDSGGRLVVEVNDDRDEYLANAHLIAKSPRMFEWISKIAKQDFVIFPEDKKSVDEIMQMLDLS